MIELVDPNDSRAIRNKNNVLRFYELVINQKKSEESIATFMTPGYIQHNPLIPDGAEALGKFFGQITKERANARVVVDKIIAVGDYVFAHVNFLNLFQRRSGRYRDRWRRYLQNGFRRKSPRALGYVATDW